MRVENRRKESFIPLGKRLLKRLREKKRADAGNLHFPPFPTIFLSILSEESITLGNFYLSRANACNFGLVYNRDVCENYRNGFHFYYTIKF